MRKLVLHLAIACSTFGVSTGLTSIWASLRGAGIPVQTVQPILYRSGWRVSPTEPGLLEIYSEYGAAQTRHDRAFFESVETEDFVLFPGDGKALSRSEDIQLMNSEDGSIVYTLDDISAETYGDAAIVTGSMSATYRDGQSHSWRWIDVCVRRGGRWQIQSTTELN
jgi:ketosteroid isomerase-like protein